VGWYYGNIASTQLNHLYLPSSSTRKNNGGGVQAAESVRVIGGLEGTPMFRRSAEAVDPNTIEKRNHYMRPRDSNAPH
jgi:hypothetical protein